MRFLGTACNRWKLSLSTLSWRWRLLRSVPPSRASFWYLGKLSLVAGVAAASLVGGVRTVECKEMRKNVRSQQLLDACRVGDDRFVKRLIDSGIDCDVRHQLGWSALHVAVVNNHLRVAELLIDAGADINAQDDYTSMMRKALEMQTAFLVIQSRFDQFSDLLPPDTDCSGFTALHYAACFGYKEMTSLLLDKGADASVCDSAGFTPEHYCIDPEFKGYLRDKVAMCKMSRQKQEALERQKFPLEQRLKESIVGQQAAIAAVASAVRRKELGWHDEDRPQVFLFLGSSGIGKTELAKQLARYLHSDNQKGFVRLDMSEYQEKHEVAKMIGAPPGYVGYTEGGQLTTKLNECPNAVVLFDEIEKAHPDALTILLQLFDEGRLTDGKGRTISCKDAIFVMTSNLISDDLTEYAHMLRKETAARRKKELDSNSPEFIEDHFKITKEFKEDVVYPTLKRFFKRDEFLGRITEIVYFLPFTRKELGLLVEKELGIWAKRAESRHNLSITWDPAVLDLLADSYDIHYGARSIKHEVEIKVVNDLARAHEKGLIRAGQRVHLVVKSGGPSPTLGLWLIEGDKAGGKGVPIEFD